MTKKELIKGILKLAKEFDEDHGMDSVIIMDDMERMVDNYVKPLLQASSLQLKDDYKNGFESYIRVNFKKIGDLYFDYHDNKGYSLEKIKVEYDEIMNNEILNFLKL